MCLFMKPCLLSLGIGNHLLGRRESPTNVGGRGARCRRALAGDRHCWLGAVTGTVAGESASGAEHYVTNHVSTDSMCECSSPEPI